MAMRPPDPYMVGKLGSRRVDRTRARLLSSRQAATVHRRARRSAGRVRVRAEAARTAASVFEGHRAPCWPQARAPKAPAAMPRAMVPTRDEKPALRTRAAAPPEQAPPRCATAPSPRPSPPPPAARRAKNIATKSATKTAVRQSPRKVKAAVVRYRPAPVYQPRKANVKGQRGRKKEVAPKWAVAKNMRYPAEALAEALKLLQPSAETHRLKGTSPFAHADCVSVCAHINKTYSVPDKGWVCELQWKHLRGHAEAVLLGQQVNRPGNVSIITQTIVDDWVAWVGLDAEDQRNPPLSQAAWMLWELCDAAGTELRHIGSAASGQFVIVFQGHKLTITNCNTRPPLPMGV
eukprot:COSAG05_NODE_1403_length_4971_cov_4.797619_2_plen_348_part_00